MQDDNPDHDQTNSLPKDTVLEKHIQTRLSTLFRKIIYSDKLFNHIVIFLATIISSAAVYVIASFSDYQFTYTGLIILNVCILSLSTIMINGLPNYLRHRKEELLNRWFYNYYSKFRIYSAKIDNGSSGKLLFTCGLRDAYHRRYYTSNHPLEMVLKAAIQHPNGLIFTVERPGHHYHLRYHLNSLLFIKKVDFNECKIGFISSEGRFLTEEEAYYVARAAKQIFILPPMGNVLKCKNLWCTN